MKLVPRLPDKPFALDKVKLHEYPFAQVLERICQRYWSEASYFLRTPISRGDIRELKKLQSAASLLIGVVAPGSVSLASPEARLAGLVRRSLKSNRAEFDANLQACLQNLSILTRLEVPRSVDKGRPENLHINNATVALCELWKELGGRKFKQNPDVVKRETKELEFVQPGPLFVFQMLQLIDPDIKAEEVRTALKLVPVKRARGPEREPFSG
ncbi:hypothetical protein ACVDG8_014735 [Mesorhizobium sp. ORM8.1]